MKSRGRASQRDQARVFAIVRKFGSDSYPVEFSTIVYQLITKESSPLVANEDRIASALRLLRQRGKVELREQEGKIFGAKPLAAPPRKRTAQTRTPATSPRATPKGRY